MIKFKIVTHLVLVEQTVLLAAKNVITRFVINVMMLKSPTMITKFVLCVLLISRLIKKPAKHIKKLRTNASNNVHQISTVWINATWITGLMSKNAHVSNQTWVNKLESLGFHKFKISTTPQSTLFTTTTSTTSTRTITTTYKTTTTRKSARTTRQSNQNWLLIGVSKYDYSLNKNFYSLISQYLSIFFKLRSFLSRLRAWQVNAELKTFAADRL